MQAFILIEEYTDFGDASNSIIGCYFELETAESTAKLLNSENEAVELFYYVETWKMQ